MPLRVRINEDVTRQNLHVIIFIDDWGQTRKALTFEDGHKAWVDWHPGTEAPSAYQFSAEHIELIYQALRKHYGDPGDPQLRQDYNAERARVDDLIAMIGKSHTGLHMLALQLAGSEEDI